MENMWTAVREPFFSSSIPRSSGWLSGWGEVEMSCLLKTGTVIDLKLFQMATNAMASTESNHAIFECGDGTIWHRGQFDTWDNLTPTMQGGQFDTADNFTPRTIWHHHKFYISTIVWPQNMIRNILIATIYLFDWKLSCIMSLYQIRARQGPHIKTYLISWQLFGPKISLEIHCWPITTFF